MASVPQGMTGNEAEGGAHEPLVVFVHIRKTAGKTLRRLLYRQYRRPNTRHTRNYFTEPGRAFDSTRELATSPPPELRVLHGHMLFWPELAWPSGTRFFTMLRDPVERTISHYYWLRTRSARFAKTLEEAVSDGTIHDNLQTRVISAEMPPFAELRETALESALERLDRFDVIGFAERFDESLALLTRAFGWRWMLYRRVNLTPNRKPRSEIEPETLELIERHNALDMELYQRARERFEADLARQDDDFRIHLDALVLASARAASVPAGAPLDLRRDEAESPGDLRHGLVEAHAAVLLRDAEIERLRLEARAHRSRGEKLPRRSPEERAARLQDAAERAKQRLDRVQEALRALEAKGAAADPEKLAALRARAATAEQRAAAVERRSAELRRRVGDGEDAPPVELPPG
jgi:hypothetical protein